MIIWNSLGTCDSGWDIWMLAGDSGYGTQMTVDLVFSNLLMTFILAVQKLNCDK